MNDLKLIKARDVKRCAYYNYLDDWGNSGMEMIPRQAALDGRSFEDWIRHLKNCEAGIGSRGNHNASATYFLADGAGELIGAVNIRPGLAEKVLHASGHAGYGIRPSRRGKGYAAKMLMMAMPIMRSFGMERALITCKNDNVASARTIIKCGGKMENIIVYNGDLIQRYWIEL